MLHLSRTVRFAINPPRPGDTAGSTEGGNGFSAVPAMQGLGRHYEMTVVVGGEASALTGYFLGIHEVDRAVRSHVIPLVAEACQREPWGDPAPVLARAIEALNRGLNGIVRRVRWKLSPYYSLEMSVNEQHSAVLRQRFEFAASHRLNVASMSAEENRALFGKCNNASGHGHNYILEPAIVVDLGVPRAFGLLELERAVERSVLRHFDHKFLNLDTPEFAPGKLNPSVENIARVCYERLAPVIAEMSGDSATLRDLTVWETEKTSCTYPAV